MTGGEARLSQRFRLCSDVWLGVAWRSVVGVVVSLPLSILALVGQS